MTEPLSVPDAVAVLGKHGVSHRRFNIWSDKYGLAHLPVHDGWQLTETPAGWLVYRNAFGKVASPYRTYPDESQAVAALLAGLLGPAEQPPAPEEFPHLRALWLAAPWRRRPANREELGQALVWLGVPPTAYALFGGNHPGRLCLEERAESWHVYRPGRENAAFTAEGPACAEFWRRLLEDLPLLRGVRPPEVVAPAEPPSAEPDLTFADVLRERPDILAVISPTYDLHRPPEGDHPVLVELPDGTWADRYTERGRTSALRTYAREGDAAAACLAAGANAESTWGHAAADRTASHFAGTRHDQLLFHWHQFPWRATPGTVSQLQTLLRDHGVPAGAYHLAGGRGKDALTLERRSDREWWVYRVAGAQRLGVTRHPGEASACGEFWRRTVDQLIPAVVEAGLPPATAPTAS
ncbi:hypothetical protein JOF53_005905 [Crossiella equi]|uniref:Uncharacterized protein n=1 Tax=Crossiella equi TaxID=130796 RepID=A0ABS5AKC7_9PSEU|nr:hypothetical protein [Crossiella equi]MBP2477033.1 hypothetical protein [Crossiella equi]